MNNKVISIEIGLQATKICEVDYKKKNPHIYNCITFQTPENTVEDGYIRDKVQFVAVLKEKIKEANMKSDKVVFTVASTKIANREVTIPLVKDNRIQDVVNANASEYFPVDISEYIVSYSVLDKIVNKDEKKLRLLVLAAPSNLIKNYYNVAEMMEYEVVSIDYIGNSIFEITKKEVNRGTNLVIQMNEQTTLLSIIKDSTLRLQRTISFGTTEVLNVVINNEEFKAKNEKEALSILNSENLIYNKRKSNQNEVAASLDSFNGKKDIIAQENEQIKNNGREEVEDSFRYLLNNIIRVLDYYTSKDNENRIDVIYVTGQGSKFKGIGHLIRRETDIEVKKIETLSSVIFNRNSNKVNIDQSEYISCIGAAMNPINFVPKEYLVSEKKNNSIFVMKVILIGAVAVSIVLVSLPIHSYMVANEENTRLENEIENLSDINTVYDANTRASDNYSKVKAMYDLTINPNEKLNELIEELEKKLPSDAIVESMNITATDITLSMKGNSKETAAKVLEQLRTFDSLTMIDTDGISQTEDENGIPTIQFVVTGKYNIETLQEDSNDGN